MVVGGYIIFFISFQIFMCNTISLIFGLKTKMIQNKDIRCMCVFCPLGFGCNNVTDYMLKIADSEQHISTL